MATTRLLTTTRGPARLHATGPERAAAGMLVLGHGAGAGSEAADLMAAEDAALGVGWRVIRVDQPWLVAGRKVAEAPLRLDAAWTEVVAAVTRSTIGPLVLGGRSAGARVACRTAGPLGASAVLALAFPLCPPTSGRSRLAELEQVEVPLLVVQGARDAFGVPTPAPGRQVRVVAGADHGFAVRRRDGRSRQDVLTEVGEAVRDLLQALT